MQIMKHFQDETIFWRGKPIETLSWEEMVECYSDACKQIGKNLNQKGPIVDLLPSEYSLTDTKSVVASKYSHSSGGNHD